MHGLVQPLIVAPNCRFIGTLVYGLQSLDLLDGDVAAAIEAINDCYPPEVVQYLRPEYAAALAERAGTAGGGSTA